MDASLVADTLAEAAAEANRWAGPHAAGIMLRDILAVLSDCQVEAELRAPGRLPRAVSEALEQDLPDPPWLQRLRAMPAPG